MANSTMKKIKSHLIYTSPSSNVKIISQSYNRITLFMAISFMIDLQNQFVFKWIYYWWRLLNQDMLISHCYLLPMDTMFQQFWNMCNNRIFLPCIPSFTHQSKFNIISPEHSYKRKRIVALMFHPRLFIQEQRIWSHILYYYVFQSIRQATNS